MVFIFTETEHLLGPAQLHVFIVQKIPVLTLSADVNGQRSWKEGKYLHTTTKWKPTERTRHFAVYELVLHVTELSEDNIIYVNVYQVPLKMRTFV